MTEREWQAFSRFRTEFKQACIHWLAQCGYEYADPAEPIGCVEKSAAQANRYPLTEPAPLHLLQQDAAIANKTPPYPLETPIVYNHSLDDITQADRIKLIIISDNPGKNEQLHKNQRYLVGQAGKVAEGFFKRNPSLNTDFRREVIVLNKTPVHTAKTKELGLVLKHADKGFTALFEETQIWLASQTAALQQTLNCPLWLVGYGELRKNSFFTAYANTLRQCYAAAGSLAEAPVFVFQHFSMNCFSIDLNRHSDPAKSTEENLRTLGLRHRSEILGW
ncbi:MAG: hypothetical protein P1P65_05495 [Treponema sp.]